MFIYATKVLTIYKKFRKNYHTGWIALFPALLLSKAVKKICFFIRCLFEHVVYLACENNKYTIAYLKKITGEKNEDILRQQLKDKRMYLANWINSSAIEKYKELFPIEGTEKINKAQLVCDHVFDLLGSGPKKVSSDGEGYQPIDWQLDFKSGYRWNATSFFRWIPLSPVEGADIIVPWELSRFQDRMALAQAYLLTGDLKFAIEFQNQVTDWIENNKFGFGANWSCAMDVAIRAANWVVIKELFETCFDFSEEFLTKFYGSLYDHARFVRRHLQRIGNTTTNHYLSSIAGLLFIALYCPFFKKSSVWLDFAVQNLENEITKQIYSDGCDYEASTSYHILVLEIFFYSLLVCEKSGVVLSQEYKTTLKKMFNVSLHYIKPNGTAPQVGDNDNGRFFKYYSRPILEHKYLLTLAVIYFKDHTFKLKWFNFSEEGFWLFGMQGKESYDNLPYRTTLNESKSFSNAGWFTLRDDKDYCFITCGPVGQEGEGGHAHNDKLSFELVLDGHDIIVDPGTYIYTPFPKERNKFRSTAYHNTIMCGNCEQNDFYENDLFYLSDTATIKNTALKETFDNISFIGEITYAGITHKRTIQLEKGSGKCKVIDEVFSLKPTTAKLSFHLSPNTFYKDGNIFIKQPHQGIASIQVEGCTIEKNIYAYSSGYGAKTDAECLVITKEMHDGSAVITTEIKKIVELLK